MAKKPDNLIFHSAFPVQEGRLRDRKGRLRLAVLDVLDEDQDDEGFEIRKITLATY